MAPSPLQQRRTHNTLLFQKLLNLRDGASPFTLVLDTLEQSGGAVVREFAGRAQIAKTKIIFISYTTLRKKIPFEINIYIPARSKTLSVLRAEILSHLPPPPTSASTSSTPSSTSNPNPRVTKLKKFSELTFTPYQEYLLIIDTLLPLCTLHAQHLSPFLSSLLISPQISLLATYHTDIPIPSPPTNHHNNKTNTKNSHHPTPLTTLLYLSTAILSISSLPHILASKRARDKSIQEPDFGLLEQREGVIQSPHQNPGTSKTIDPANNEDGVVVNMEIRRRSGRGVVENFVLLPPQPLSGNSSSLKGILTSSLILLDEHPLFAPPSLPHLQHSHAHGNGEGDEEGEEEVGTFSLHLTEKQKRDREGIVLPYFDAQKHGGMRGVGEGGRILYEMGSEDREDFDDEEDEI